MDQPQEPQNLNSCRRWVPLEVPGGRERCTFSSGAFKVDQVTVFVTLAHLRSAEPRPSRSGLFRFRKAPEPMRFPGVGKSFDLPAAHVEALAGVGLRTAASPPNGPVSEPDESQRP